MLLDDAVSMGHLVGTENEFQRSCAAETALSAVVELHLGGRWTSNAKDPLIHCNTSILSFDPALSHLFVCFLSHSFSGSDAKLHVGPHNNWFQEPQRCSW